MRNPTSPSHVLDVGSVLLGFPGALTLLEARCRGRASELLGDVPSSSACGSECCEYGWGCKQALHGNPWQSHANLVSKPAMIRRRKRFHAFSKDPPPLYQTRTSSYPRRFKSTARLPGSHAAPHRPREGLPQILHSRTSVKALVPWCLRALMPSQALNFNWVELMALAHHPFLGSWGYQVSGHLALKVIQKGWWEECLADMTLLKEGEASVSGGLLVERSARFQCDSTRQTSRHLQARASHASPIPSGTTAAAPSWARRTI